MYNQWENCVGENGWSYSYSGIIHRVLCNAWIVLSVLKSLTHWYFRFSWMMIVSLDRGRTSRAEKLFPSHATYHPRHHAILVLWHVLCTHCLRYRRFVGCYCLVRRIRNKMNSLLLVPSPFVVVIIGLSKLALRDWQYFYAGTYNACMQQIMLHDWHLLDSIQRLLQA